MKRFFPLAITAALLLALTACGGKNSIQKVPNTQRDSVTIELGRLYACIAQVNPQAKGDAGQQQLKDMLLNVYKFPLDTGYFNTGMRTVPADTTITLAQLVQARDDVFKHVEEFRVQGTKGDATIQANRDAGTQYALKAIAADGGYTMSPTGLLYKVVKPGSGAKFTASSNVMVAYKGSRTTDSVFTDTGKTPIQLNMHGVVPGFQEAVLMMSPGAQLKVIVPGYLAYGYNGRPQMGFAPDETLIFEIAAK